MAGKGSKPRNCFSSKFKKNFEEIDWKKDEKFRAVATTDQDDSFSEGEQINQGDITAKFNDIK